MTVTRADLLEGAAAGRRPRLPLRRARWRGRGAVVPPAASGRSRSRSWRRAGGWCWPTRCCRPICNRTAPGNEFFFNQILYDVITGLWGDVEREAPPPRRRPQDVPGAQPRAGRAALVSQGFVIEGTAPCARARACWGRCWALSSTTGGCCRREGNSDDYVHLAAGGAGARSPAGRRRGPGRCGPVWVRRRRGVASGAAERISRLRCSPSSGRRPRRRPRPDSPPGPPPGWWISSPAQPGAPHRGSAAPADPLRDRRRSARSDAANAPRPSDETDTSEKPSRPTWMKDFDS